MRAALLHENLDITIEKVEKPFLKNNEILINLRSCGVCATDVKKFTGKSSTPNFPFILGHEPAGVIATIGADVDSDLKVGDRIAIAPVIVCGNCRGCKSGLVAKEGMGMCAHYDVVGYSTNGALAEYIAMPPENIFKIPDALSFRDAALIEPVAACANGVLKAIQNPPGKAVVLGGGFMGLTSLALLKMLGAQVLITDMLDDRLDAARQLGADEVVNPKKDDLEAAVERFTDGKGADSILCAIGVKSLTENGIRMLSPGGRMVLLASAQKGTTVEFDLNNMHYFHNVITGSVSYTQEQFVWVMELLTKKLIDTDVLITHVGGLEDVEKFMEMTRDTIGLKKVILMGED
jgi:L-iditol 2-dehydrogenase